MRRPNSTARSLRSAWVSRASRNGSSRSSGRCSACSSRYAASSYALVVPWPNARCAAPKRVTDQRSQSRTVSGSGGGVIARGIAGARRSREQPLEDAAVDRGERLEVGDGDALVELVDGRVDRPELDDLVADVRDEAAVRRAAFGG